LWYGIMVAPCNGIKALPKSILSSRVRSLAIVWPLQGSSGHCRDHLAIKSDDI
jgi:hypothetical protein